MFTPAAVFPWFVWHTLQGLRAVEFDDVVAVLTRGGAEGRSVYEIAQRLEPILLPAAYQWPTLEHWRADF